MSDEVRISPRTGKPIDERYSRKKKINRNSPVIGMNGYNLEDGDNTKVVGVNIALFNMPGIDIYDADEVRERIGEYLKLYAEADLKPTVAGLAIALGVNRRTLWAVANDQPTGGTGYRSALPTTVTDLIKKTYKMLENMWETYMNSGKINPVAGIFLGKNHYGFQDKTEYVVTPNTNQDNDYSTDEIKKRYLIDDQNDSDTD